jgi:hypothetical protein
LKPDGTPMTIPYLPITIKPAIGRAAQQNYWEIITQDGLVYTFGQGSSTIEESMDNKQVVRGGRDVNIVDNQIYYKSTWYINNIQTTDNITLATFTYKYLSIGTPTRGGYITYGHYANASTRLSVINPFSC